MFIRKKKIGAQEYAYLVENRYNKKKKQSRQKSKGYLGKIIKLGQSNTPTKASTLNDAVINELIKYNFRKSKGKLIKDNIIIDIENSTVREGNKNICLEMNQGFLCNKTLINLLNFNTHNLNQKEIVHKLAESLISGGINIHHESFIEIFNSFKKAQNLQN